MGYTIVSGNKPSPVALHQNHPILFIEMLKEMPKFYSKSQNEKSTLLCDLVRHLCGHTMKHVLFSGSYFILFDCPSMPMERRLRLSNAQPTVPNIKIKYGYRYSNNIMHFNSFHFRQNETQVFTLLTCDFDYICLCDSEYVN